MSKKCYIIELSADERKRLEEQSGKARARPKNRGANTLGGDESPLGPKWNDPKISEALGTDLIMCDRVRQQWRGGGVNRKQRATRPVPRIFDGEKEVGLLATSRRLREMNAALVEVVELNIVDA